MEAGMLTKKDLTGASEIDKKIKAPGDGTKDLRGNILLSFFYMVSSIHDHHACSLQQIHPVTGLSALYKWNGSLAENYHSVRDLHHSQCHHLYYTTKPTGRTNQQKTR